MAKVAGRALIYLCQPAKNQEHESRILLSMRGMEEVRNHKRQKTGDFREMARMEGLI